MKECNIEIYVDADNVSYRRMDEIFLYVKASYRRGYGEKIPTHIFKLEKNECTKNWNEISSEDKSVKIIMHNLEGQPEKNKVDNYIIEAIKNKLKLNKKNPKLFILIASDKDYCEIVRKIREYNRDVHVIGDKTASSALKNSPNKFIAYQDLKKETARIRNKEKRQRDEAKLQKEKEKRSEEEKRLREKGKKWQEEEKKQKEEKRRQNLITGVQLYIIKLIENQWMDLRKLKYAVEDEYPEFKYYNMNYFKEFVEEIYNVEIDGGRAIRKS